MRAPPSSLLIQQSPPKRKAPSSEASDIELMGDVSPANGFYFEIDDNGKKPYMIYERYNIASFIVDYLVKIAKNMCMPQDLENVQSLLVNPVYIQSLSIYPVYYGD